jgi:hypothetical protein
MRARDRRDLVMKSSRGPGRFWLALGGHCHADWCWSVSAEMFQDIRTVTTLFNDITPTVSKYWEGPGMSPPVRA